MIVHFILTILSLLQVALAAHADAPPVKLEQLPAPHPYIDLTGYKKLADATRADPKLFRDTAFPVVSAVPFFGLEIEAVRPVIDDIAPDSPAAEANLRVGDVLTHIGQVAVDSSLAAKEQLRLAPVGQPLSLKVSRGGGVQTLSITPRPLSKPFTNTTASRAVLGIQTGEPRSDGGIEITAVTDGGAAQKAGVKNGDILRKLDNTVVDAANPIREVLSARKPGDLVRLTLLRGKEEVVVRATLQSDSPVGPRTAGWDDRLPSAWKKPVYKLAVIGIEYPDVKHNEKIRSADWEESLFSLGTYKDKSVTGGSVYGSMQDYYQEISCGQLKIEGKFVGWVEVGKKRTEYSTGIASSGREKTSLLSEAIDKLLAKDKEALAGYDGIFFLYAGDRVQTSRGGLYWPHRATLNHGGKRWPYFIVQEGGNRMTNISVFCHEFGHMLGLPDLYARPEVPGMEGVGEWCAMSQQKSNGRPQHFSAWCKEQLGWIQTVAIDPRVKQKLILAPIENTRNECLKILIKPDGSEYLLLENRRQIGFDKDLPAEGLLIWRVTPGNRTQAVYLEEAHGVDGPSGPRAYPSAVPFPSPANTAFTPLTTPSSKAVTGGGLEVHITNIRRLSDGRIALQIGYEYQ